MDWLRDLWAATAETRGHISELLSGFGGWVGSFHMNLSQSSAIVASVLFLALAVPSIVNAWVDRRAPMIGFAMLIVGGLMTFWTLNTYPQDYVWQDIPMAFIDVIASILN